MTTPSPASRSDGPQLTPHEARVARRLHALRRQALREMHEQRRHWRFRVHHGRVVFDHDFAVLQYLNAIEKANCTFCTYANGVIAYVREVAARTEQYWCPITHARDVPAPHARYHHFFDYGDAEAYHRDLPALRRRLRPGSGPPPRRPHRPH